MRRHPKTSRRLLPGRPGRSDASLPEVPVVSRDQAETVPPTTPPGAEPTSPTDLDEETIRRMLEAAYT